MSSAVSFREALRVWLRIGLLSFGGPAGQIALMHRELVERRRWISDERFMHALNYCMLLPGPEAQQLATYIGWLLHRTRGGIAAGVLFILPGALTILVLSCLYVVVGSLPAVAALFFGLKAAVVAIVIDALVRVSRRALKAPWHVVGAGAAFVAIAFLGVAFPWVIVGAAVLGFAVGWRRKPVDTGAHDGAAPGVPAAPSYLIDDLHARGALSHVAPSATRAVVTTACGILLWFAPLGLAAVILGTRHVIVNEGVFFGQTAIVTFGGAYAVLTYVAQYTVHDLRWLSASSMIDGLALAETTPGPLILVLQFVGFVAAYNHPGALGPLLAGMLGAALTTWMTFVPSFLFIFVGAPYVERLRHFERLNAALQAITAAVVGVILNLSLWFALRTLFADVRTVELGWFHFDWPVVSSLEPAAMVLTTLALVALLRFKIAMGWVLIGAALLGAAYRFVAG